MPLFRKMLVRAVDVMTRCDTRGLEGKHRQVLERGNEQELKALWAC